MLRLVLCLCAALAFPLVPLSAAPRQPQGPVEASTPWARNGDRIVFTPAAIGFPTEAGAVTLEETTEFSHRGEHLDNALQFESPDRELFATVYVYYPALPHAGLAALATDNAIRVQSGSDLRVLRTGVVAAGGHDRVAIRTEYAGYREERMASSAAFIRAGGWIVKLRVSAPEARRGDVERTMTALLDGIRFGREAAPRAAAPIGLSECPAAPAQPAAPLRSNAADALEESIIGVLDGAQDGGREEGARHPAATPAIGARWCRSSTAHVGNSTVPILRSVQAADGEGFRSIAIAIVSDAGSFVEIVSTPRDRIVLLYHDIARTRLLGAFASPPTDEQIVAILSGSDREGGRIRATVVHNIDGNSDIEIHEALPESGAPTT